MLFLQSLVGGWDWRGVKRTKLNQKKKKVFSSGATPSFGEVFSRVSPMVFRAAWKGSCVTESKPHHWRWLGWTTRNKSTKLYFCGSTRKNSFYHMVLWSIPIKNLGKSEGGKKKRLITQSRATVTSYIRYNKCQKNFDSKLLIFLLVWNLQRSFLLSMCLVKSFSSEFASGSMYSFIFKHFVPCWFYLKITRLACARFDFMSVYNLS